MEWTTGFSPSLRRLTLSALVVVFVALILSAYFQYRLAWNDLDGNLKAGLSLEGRILASWLSEELVPIEDLDPLSWNWEKPRSVPRPMEFTGSSWVLLDASGELATYPTGEPMYRFRGPSGEVDWKDELSLVRKAARGPSGTVVSTGLVEKDGKYVERVYIPVWEVSGIISRPWVLAGQTGQGFFSDLFKKQREFWWTSALLSVGLLAFLILLFRGIVRTEKLERSLREAEESMEIESLTSTLAHELRNPLSIIQSSAEILLRDESLSDDGAELVFDLIS